MCNAAPVSDLHDGGQLRCQSACCSLPTIRLLPACLPACRMKDDRQMEHMNVMKAGSIAAHRIVAVSNK